MKRLVFVALPIAVSLVVVMATRPRAAEKATPHLAHMVFFTLKDHSQSSKDKFIASCQKYLDGHEGTLSFSVGTIAEDVKEPNVSDRDFDAALHLVFESKEAGARYLVNPRHLKFVEENKDSFAKVRVFDSYLAVAK